MSAVSDRLDPDEMKHAPDCMIWQIDAAADRGDGFPEPEDVACTCRKHNDPDCCDDVPTPPVSEADDERNSRPEPW
jgi:hypothetical protein